MDIDIRKCRAKDAAFLARSILIAGRAHVSKGIWEVVLNMTEEECLLFFEHAIVTEIPHLFHYSCYLLAETTGNIPIGSLGGYDPKKSGYQALQQALPEVYKKLGFEVIEEIRDKHFEKKICSPGMLSLTIKL